MTLANRYRHLLVYFKIAILIPLCLFVVMAPYSLLLGWNVITLIIFWFFIVPGVILYLSARLFKDSRVTGKAMVSLITFYSIMVFMTYKHFQSDYFAMMLFSFLFNLLVMGLVMFVERRDSR